MSARRGAPHAPPLDEHEQQEAVERTTVGAHVIHEAVRRQGEAELARSAPALAWSGLAAGLSMGFSLIGQGVLHARLPGRPWAELVTCLGYPVGFLIVILGRQQLFTENTLIPVVPLLARRDRATLRAVARLWTVVFLANLVGTIVIASVLARTALFPPEVHAGFAAVATALEGTSFVNTVLRAVFAGWLIALLAWIVGGAREPGVAVIVALTYVVALGRFSHVVAGSVDAFYLVATGTSTLGAYVFSFLVPTLIGNVVGGVSLVAALNHSQVVAGSPEEPSGR